MQWLKELKFFHLDPFRKRNLFATLVSFLCCLNFTAAISIIHRDVSASLVFPMWKRLVTVSSKFPIKQCQIFRRTMRTLLQDLAQKSLKGLGTKAWTNWEDTSANSLAYQVSNHSTFFNILDVSACRVLIWWEPFFTTSKDSALPQNF